MLHYLRQISTIFIAASFITCSNDMMEYNDFESFDTAISEPSDLCLSFSGNSLLTVSDKGAIFEIGFDGRTIRKFDQYRNPDPANPDDLEGICIDPVNRNIFVVNERTLRISRLDENGRFLDDFVVPSTILKPQDINSGIEGISLHDNVFYFVNQKKPCVLFSYNRITQQWSAPVNLTFSDGVNAVSYDATDNTLWILSSKSQKLFQCTLTGKPLKALDVPFIPKGEGVWVDRTHNVAWICCDQTGKLYKVSLKNLNKI